MALRPTAFSTDLVTGALFVVVTACASGARETAPARPAAERPGPSAVVPPRDAAPQTAPDAGSAPASATPDKSAAPKSDPVTVEEEKIPDPPGSTRGTIACGAARCDAKRQVCFHDDTTQRCVDRKAAPDTGGTLSCDDGTDCGPGLTCCQTAASAYRVLECTKRHGAGSTCAMEVCKPDGARCPRETHCEDDYCVSGLAATCPTASGKRTCASDEFCEWKAGVASCVKDPASVEPGESRGVFGCTRPQDCATGNGCCTSMTVAWQQTYCATNCDLSNTSLICETVADCKPKLQLIPPHLRHQAKLSCEAREGEGPSWLKQCEVDVP